MAKTQQTFVNKKSGPIYVSVEPWPECFELEPGDRLTLIWDADPIRESAQVDFINERELIVHPDGALDQMQFFINGEVAREKRWDFSISDSSSASCHFTIAFGMPDGPGQRQ